MSERYTHTELRQVAAWIAEVERQGYMITRADNDTPHTRVHDWCDRRGIPFARVILARHAVLTVDFSTVAHATNTMVAAAVACFDSYWPARDWQHVKCPGMQYGQAYWYIHDWPLDLAHDLMRKLLAIALPTGDEDAA